MQYLYIDYSQEAITGKTGCLVQRFFFSLSKFFLISLSYSYENHTSTEFEASSIYCHKEVYGNESS